MMMVMVSDVFSVRGASTESGVAPEMPRYLSASDAAARIGGMDGSEGGRQQCGLYQLLLLCIIPLLSRSPLRAVRAS